MKDYKILNDNKMPKKSISVPKNSAPIVKKNKFIGLVIDSSDSEDEKPTFSKKEKLAEINKTIELNEIPNNTKISESNNSVCDEPLEQLKEIDIPKKEKFGSDWKVIDKKQFREGGQGRRIIKEKEIFERIEDVDYGDNLYLPSSWDVYCHKKSISDWTKDSYSYICPINSLGTFCRFFNNFNNLDKLTYEFFIMKDKILPIWEDNANRKGGICSILLNSVFDKKTKTDIGSEIMLAVCILMMNGNLIKDNDKINGISYSLRARNTVVIKIWYNDCKFDMKEQLPFALFEYFEGRINGGFKNDSVSKHISIRFSNIEPVN